MPKADPQPPTSPDEDKLNDLSFEPEEYEEALLYFENPEILYRLPLADDNENDLDKMGHPYREDLAYINDLEALTATEESPDDPEAENNTRE